MFTALRLILMLARLQAGRTMRRLGLTIGLLAAALLCAAVGLAGLVAALWIWLARAYDPVTAALIVGGGGMAAALVLLLVARSRARAPDAFSALADFDWPDALKDRKAEIEVWAPLIGVALLGFLLGARPKE